MFDPIGMMIILGPDDIGLVTSDDIGFWVHKSYVIKLRLSPKKTKYGHSKMT